VPLVGEGDVNVWLPRSPAGQKLKAHIVYQWPLKPPVKKGDQVALLRVTTASEAMSEVPLYAAEDVAPGGTMRRGLDSILCLATRGLPSRLRRRRQARACERRASALPWPRATSSPLRA